MAVFLLVFRPFGLIWNDWSDPVFWLILGLAPFNAAMVVGLDALMSRLQSRWAILSNQYVSLLITVSFIVLGNVLYQLILQDNFQWARVLTITWRVFLIALFPTLFVLLIHRQRRGALPTESEETVFRFQDESNRESVSVSSDDLLFISADRNYILIHTRSTNKPYLLRSSLKTIEMQLKDSPVIRCHRSYLVHTKQVIHCRRLSRSLQLTLKDSTSVIPVSVSYIQAVEDRLS